MAETESPHEQQQTGTQKISPANFKKVGELLAQRWPEYLLEIMVVIIGITISFALNNFQENTSDNRLEQTHLKGMYEDITSDILELERVINQTKTVLESGQRLLKQSNSEKISSVIDRPNFVSKNITFSSLKGASNLQLIRDLNLKNLLFDYDQKYQALKTVELAELHAVVVITGPYIIKYIPLTDSIRSEEWLERLHVVDILGDVEFVNNIVLRLGNRQDLLQSYEAILKTSRQIQEQLQRNLDSPENLKHTKNQTILLQNSHLVQHQKNILKVLKCSV